MKNSYAFALLLVGVLFAGNSMRANAGVIVRFGVPVYPAPIYPPPVPVVRPVPTLVPVPTIPAAPVVVAPTVVPYVRWWGPGPYRHRYWHRW